MGSRRFSNTSLGLGASSAAVTAGRRGENEADASTDRANRIADRFGTAGLSRGAGIEGQGVSEPDEDGIYGPRAPDATARVIRAARTGGQVRRLPSFSIIPL